MKIKICGITNLDDALMAIDAGADMLGFIFYPNSKRYVLPSKCQEIQEGIHKRRLNITTIGVFVNSTYRDILKIKRDCQLNMVQFSGDESLELCLSMKTYAYKSIRPKSLSEADALASQFNYREEPPALLLDTYVPSTYGGTGRLGDWNIALILAKKYQLLLAGGLQCENVIQAIEKVKPWGVDVASGVERAPGIKDENKVRDFIMRVRTYGE